MFQFLNAFVGCDINCTKRAIYDASGGAKQYRFKNERDLKSVNIAFLALFPHRESLHFHPTLMSLGHTQPARPVYLTSTVTTLQSQLTPPRSVFVYSQKRSEQSEKRSEEEN